MTNSNKIFFIFFLTFSFFAETKLYELANKFGTDEAAAIFYEGKLYAQKEITLPDKINKKDLDTSIVAGSVRFNGSLCRQAISLLEAVLPHQISANIIGKASLNNIQNGQIATILREAKKDNPSGNVAILEDVILTKTFNGFERIPQDAHIKIAYTMFESSRIPQAWVSLINKLDAIVVPDEYIKKIYIKPGVTIPIFVVPLGLYLQEFLDLPEKTAANQKFTFGCIAMEVSRKNLATLIKSFGQTFGKNKDVQLILKVSPSAETKPDYLEKLIKKHGRKNIKIIRNSLSWYEYVKLMASFDCYIYISKGEGFSITPREAMAASIPCILTNNTAQKTICKTGLVRSVKSKVKEPASFFWFNKEDLKQCGYQFNCTQEDVVNAMLDVYNNYDFWLSKASQAKEWVKQYTNQNLALKYVNMIKPKTIILGPDNQITNDYLMTNNVELFNKYVQLQL